MTLPDHELKTTQAALQASREHDLRRRGLYAALASGGGTCAAVVVGLLYGALYGAAVLVATFMLLVVVLMTSSVRASRKPLARPGEAPELES